MSDGSVGEGVAQGARRSRATGDVRAKILDGAAVVFGAHGYARATTRAIARAAGVAEGTIFNHFDNKAAVLTALVERELIESIPQLMVSGEGFRETLLRLMRNRIELLRRNFGVIKAMLAEAFFNPELAEHLREHVFSKGFAELTAFLQAAMDRGDIRQGRPEMMGRAIIAMVIGQAVVLELAVPVACDVDVDALARQIVSVVADGIEARPGA